MVSANLQAMSSWSHHAFMYPSCSVIQENFIFNSVNDLFSLECEKAIDTRIWGSPFSHSEHPIELGQEDRVMKRNTIGAMKPNLILQGTMSLAHGMKSCMRDRDVFLLPTILMSSFLHDQCALHHFLCSPSLRKSRDKISFKRGRL
jgi:hypothetical protein